MCQERSSNGCSHGLRSGLPTVLTRARVQAGHVPSTCSRRAATSAAFRRWLLAPKRSSMTLVAGRPHCRTRASCWKRLERENVHASVALADVWTVLERGLLLDRLKRARRRDPRRKDGAGVCGLGSRKNKPRASGEKNNTTILPRAQSEGDKL